MRVQFSLQYEQNVTFSLSKFEKVSYDKKQLESNWNENSIFFKSAFSKSQTYNVNTSSNQFMHY